MHSFALHSKCVIKMFDAMIIHRLNGNNLNGDIIVACTMHADNHVNSPAYIIIIIITMMINVHNKLTTAVEHTQCAYEAGPISRFIVYLFSIRCIPLLSLLIQMPTFYSTLVTTGIIIFCIQWYIYKVLILTLYLCTIRWCSKYCIYMYTSYLYNRLTDKTR